MVKDRKITNGIHSYKRSDREVEVVTSGSRVLMENAVRRLKESGKRQKVLMVPDRDFQDATRIMREVGLPGTVKSLEGERVRYVNRQEIQRQKKVRNEKAKQDHARPFPDIWSFQI